MLGYLHYGYRVEQLNITVGYRVFRMFGQMQTGIQVVSGMLNAVDLANVSFGQGLSASAIQLATAFSAIANKGDLMQPFLVESVRDEKGKILYRGGSRLVRRVVSPATADRMKTILCSVTEPEGTGSAARIPGFSIAGKTGTAQKYDFRRGRYTTKEHVASFIAFLPAKDPALVLLVAVDEPTTSPYGGVVAAPVFRKIAIQATRLLGLEPDTPEPIHATLAKKTTKERS